MTHKMFLRICLSVILLSIVHPAFGQGTVLVKTQPVSEQSFHDQISLVGRTSAKITSSIVSEVSGRVDKIDASEGIGVKAGQPLLTIDSERLSLALQAKEAETEQARLRSELAHKDRQRAQQLHDQKLISATGLDSAITWDAIQTAQYRQLDAERARLNLDFENSVIRAPYSGHTGRRLIDVGDWVNPGQPVFEMVDLSSIKIIVDLPEKYFGHLRIGSSVDITVSNGTSTILKGRVSGISPNASQDTHTFPIIIEADNSGGRLGGGMLVRTTLSLNEQFTSLAVSKDAIVRQGDKTMVYTVNEGKATPIPVTITSTDGQILAVESQMLQIGMQVVVRGNERIYPGATVTTGDEQPANPAAKSAELEG